MRHQASKLGRRAALNQDTGHARLYDPAAPHDEYQTKAVAEDILNLVRDHNHCIVLEVLVDQIVDFGSSGRVQTVANIRLASESPLIDALCT